jgi:hypothetical protein
MWGMPMQRLIFWYRGHQHMADEETAKMNAMMGGGRK